PTGYPVYISLIWLFKYLVPFGTIAWRVNLFSALAAAGTIAGLFALCRLVTGRRDAALYSALALTISYTFWSQAIIAEAYTIGTLWWVLMLLCLWHWQRDPEAHLRWLFAAAMLSGLGMGVHFYTTLIAPAALTLYWQTAKNRPNWRRSFLTAAAGLGLGLSIYLLAFYVIDAQQSVSDFNRMMFGPSASAWGLSPSDLDTPAERFYHVVGSTQWQSAMFPEGLSLPFMMSRFARYGSLLFEREFSLLTLVAALVGGVLLLRQNQQIANLLLIGYLIVLMVILNYDPADKHLFYLPSYIMLLVAASVGVAELIRWVERHFRLNIPNNLILIFLLLQAGQYFWPSRLQALADGKASFVTDTYPYPVEDLTEPRSVATALATQLPDGSLALFNWRHLYTTLYVAHVEQGKTTLGIIEPTPYGTNGRITDSLVAIIETALEEGRPVFADSPYDLSRHFNVEQTTQG
ncbi:MAG: protein O-mannosyl-transferase family, partial [Candidatus Promineifilaceae bacterium]